MNMIVCALDVSKGYADVVLTGPDASLLCSACLDDLPEGHQTLLAMVRDAHHRFGDAVIRCGAENTGGLERTWLRTLRTLTKEIPGMEVLALNPLAVSRMLEHQLHRAVTDKHSARGIAHYLRVIDNPAVASTPVAMEGVRMLLGVVHIQGAIEQELRNQFQSFLPLVYPELVRFCRNHIPVSVLRIVGKYPSPAKLARAHVDTLTAIPHVSRQDAQALIAAAKQSVTLLDSSEEARTIAEDGAIALRLLARKILAAMKETGELEHMLVERMKTHPAFDVLVSIKGIGEVSAAKVIVIIGDITRFPNASKLIAYAGLDPMVRESGDKRAVRRISKRGNRRLRTVIFNNVRSAIRCPGPVKDFYDHLRDAGKPHMTAYVACMSKMLRIVYACWLSGEHYDPRHDRHMVPAVQHQDPQQVPVKDMPPQVHHTKSEIVAPVSGREAKRRLQQQRREEEALLQGNIVPCT